MRSALAVLAAGAAILTAAAVSPVMAEDNQVHVLTVQLPGGGIEQIQYTGDVQPRVVLVPSPAMVAAPTIATDPFATLERISAMMDRQADAMLRQLPAMAATLMDPVPALPPGANGYSFVSTMSGNGVCMHSVRITYNGGAPKVVSNTSGDCGPDAAQRPSDVNTPSPAIRPASKTIEARAGGEPLRQVAWDR